MELSLYPYLSLVLSIEVWVSHLLPGDVVGDPVLLDVGGPGGHVLHHLQAIFTLVVISSLQYSVLSRRSLIVTDFTIFRYGSSCNSLYFDLAPLI